jgi:hypothetical protein
MKRLLTLLRPRAAKFQGATKAKSAHGCREQFFAAVFWLAPQVCYLSCSVLTSAMLLNPGDRQHSR